MYCRWGFAAGSGSNPPEALLVTVPSHPGGRRFARTVWGDAPEPCRLEADLVRHRQATRRIGATRWASRVNTAPQSEPSVRGAVSRVDRFATVRTRRSTGRKGAIPAVERIRLCGSTGGVAPTRSTRSGLLCAFRVGVGRWGLPISTYGPIHRTRVLSTKTSSCVPTCIGSEELYFHRRLSPRVTVLLS